MRGDILGLRHFVLDYLERCARDAFGFWTGKAPEEVSLLAICDTLYALEFVGAAGVDHERPAALGEGAGEGEAEAP